MATHHRRSSVSPSSSRSANANANAHFNAHGRHGVNGLVLTPSRSPSTRSTAGRSRHSARSYSSSPPATAPASPVTGSGAAIAAPARSSRPPLSPSSGASAFAATNPASPGTATASSLPRPAAPGSGSTAPNNNSQRRPGQRHSAASARDNSAAAARSTAVTTIAASSASSSSSTSTNSQHRHQHRQSHPHPHQHQHQHQHLQPQRRHHRRASASSAASPPSRPVQDILPHHDCETAHLASYSSHSKRSSSRDRTSLPASTRGADAAAEYASPSVSSSQQAARRASTRSSSRRHHHQPHPSVGMAPSAVATNNGGSSATPPCHAASYAAPDPHHQSHTATKQNRSRTTVPTQSGKWILGKTIGAGSMGKVKLARKEDGSEQVACKIVPRGSTEEHQSRADKERADQSKEIRTAREAAIVTLLNHPHICGMRDVVRTNYHWYMLFEYVNGGQMLDYIISHGKLKEKQARKFSRQIASALDYCHRNSIVHRDLKIENILISKTGDIKIIDFGLSNLFSPRGHLKTFCGSLYFAAPELLQARAYTGPEVDVWSFGIVLYVLVCGKVPFDDQSMPALHAKIKKGLVDYPTWLSSECKHLMSRMLVTDPKQRATMQEVMNHPWMTKGFYGPPDNYLPSREPLTHPLDPDVIHAMQGFNFGSPEAIRAQLSKIIDSEDYQHAVKLYQREREAPPPPAKDAERRRGFGFDFYKRRNSSNSRDTLTGLSSDTLQLGHDPLYAFSPLLSIYYLVKEKQDREPAQQAPVSSSGSHEKEKEKERTRERERERERERDHRDRDYRDRDKGADAMPELAPPQAAHTNATAYEMPGERPTGGRSRPRARTHGEDDAPESARQHGHAPPPPPAESKVEQLQKKEGTAAGLLRRFSTRKRREPERLDKDRSHPPMVQVHSPSDPAPAPATPKKSFSIRRGRRDRDEPPVPPIRSGSSQPHHGALLSPPLSAPGTRGSRMSGLGRSTSVNSAEMRRRQGGRLPKEAAATSSSDQSMSNDQSGSSRRTHGHSRSVSMRTKSLSHARRESVQRRRMRREGVQEADVPEETDFEPDQSGVSTDRLDSAELAKPVFLKGLFSVSTTSGKSVPAIRADIKRVLKQLNVGFAEIKGGFFCRHTPSIDLNKVHDPPTSPGQASGHRRRFSFGGLMRNDDREEIRDLEREQRQPQTPRTPGRPDRERDRSDRDRSYSNSETSVDSIPRRNGGTTRRVPGETSTQVQSDLGESMVLEFEIFIVKVPLLSLHGIQFKRMTGNTWQFKNMADQILRDLRL
ncbi:Serine/threonine-protein kinase domain protein [Metarhizium album ARSEF 1941]|uniref:non-specific serine/threonine protein kinase n=1 Tax=Metarhizium album (strain ARSEF 1941) TaxID=1081103 RepID=A0A0B2X050_METAS|nr:Serine/threonine-protein kinase domain protein [Metarhizium album ARSEF 1941]KHN99062.1 Serine/threonine-protein kinase domain protein [Metarhizium album ARSEF 1941]